MMIGSHFPVSTPAQRLTGNASVHVPIEGYLASAQIGETRFGVNSLATLRRCCKFCGALTTFCCLTCSKDFICHPTKSACWYLFHSLEEYPRSQDDRKEMLKKPYTRRPGIEFRGLESYISMVNEAKTIETSPVNANTHNNSINTDGKTTTNEKKDQDHNCDDDQLETKDNGKNDSKTRKRPTVDLNEDKDEEFTIRKKEKKK
jgi:hypothetical protein